MTPHEIRTTSLVSLVPIVFLVRHTTGIVESSPRGAMLTALIVLVGSAPLLHRLVERSRERATARPTDDGPYRTDPLQEAAPPPSSFARGALGDALCVVLALAVWAELRSAEPLQRIPIPAPYAQRCVSTPC